LLYLLEVAAVSVLLQHSTKEHFLPRKSMFRSANAVTSSRLILYLGPHRLLKAPGRVVAGRKLNWCILSILDANALKLLPVTCINLPMSLREFKV